MEKYKGMTYTVRKDGLLMKKITVPNKKPIYIYSNDKEDLRNKFIELQYNSLNGTIDDKSVLLKPFAEKWIQLNSVNVEYRTKKEYEDIVRLYINPNLGTKRIADIKSYDIKELMEKMKNTPTSAKKTLQLLKRILNEAIDNDIIVKNVANNIKAPKIIKKEKLPLSIEEDKQLILSNSKYASFFIFMRFTGMRKEEIIPITINDVDLENKTISINKAVTFINSKPTIKTTKNNKTRTVPILDKVYAIVKDLYNNAIKNNRELLFVKETDEQMLTDSAIRRHLESFLYSINKNYEKQQKELNKDFKLTKENKIKFTCHQLRHSYCTMLYYSGIKIKEAQNLMGHSSADMVYNIYTHLDSERENTAETLNNYIKKLY